MEEEPIRTVHRRKVDLKRWKYGSRNVKQEPSQLFPSHKISEIHFGIMGPDDVEKQSVACLTNCDLYGTRIVPPAPGDPHTNSQKTERTAVAGGLLDPRLGVALRGDKCETCHQSLELCAGHFGHIELALPVFHIGYLKLTITLLNQVCKACSRILLNQSTCLTFANQLMCAGGDHHRRKELVKTIIATCKKAHVCPWCKSINGVVKRVANTKSMKLVHDIWTPKKHPEHIAAFRARFGAMVQVQPDIESHLVRAKQDLTPPDVLRIFKEIPPQDCALLDMDAVNGRPERLIITRIPVPPTCIRPSVPLADGESQEDDLTICLKDIIRFNELLRESQAKGEKIARLYDRWDHLHLEYAKFINSDAVKDRSQTKTARGLAQRLKGKQGRFRQNLSGKRVDFSARTVISPDPNLSIEEVGLPVHVCTILTYPERVTKYNIKRLRRTILRGPEHPGANFVKKVNDPNKIYLRHHGIRERAARELRYGDVVERHVADGDVVLFNRQPSLHKMSIMAHKARVMPHRTFRFNECVCNPYNADFDGDEMNVHVPQTEEARVEALLLMGVRANLVTPRSGVPLIAAIQDFITASYLLSRKDRFYDRAEFALMCCWINDASAAIDMPPPAILKPVALWTGKQVFSVLLRPTKNDPVSLNLERKCPDSYGKSPAPLNALQTERYVDYMDVNDGYTIIWNSELLCGVMDKKVIGSGSKDSVFHLLYRDWGASVCVQRMSSLAKLCARWLSHTGFSIGLSDVQPSQKLQDFIHSERAKSYRQCEVFIKQYESGRMEPNPGCSTEETLEGKLTKELSDMRTRAGNLCMSELHPLNAAVVMNVCGSKGNLGNISQMVAGVGQQVIMGKRIPNGFERRTLPHFALDSKEPLAKGFVANSFYSGLTPTEFFFHTMSGRVGLVDTAVKTAETGYMQRKMMKALEDLVSQYDGTVRNSTGQVMQFTYGDDGLDPSGMEANQEPVQAHRILRQVQHQYLDPQGKRLTGAEIAARVNEKLDSFHFMSAKFRDRIRAFFCGKANRSRGYVHQVDSLVERWQDVGHRIDSVTAVQLEHFFTLLKRKYLNAMMEPGTAVGALAAQSLGEPATQMTLKTFHFAGVASMNITLGVPRLKEIINATKSISTPIITAPLVNTQSEAAARMVKGRIEMTTLADIAKSFTEVIAADSCYLVVDLDLDVIEALRLELDIRAVALAIERTPKMKLTKQNIRLRSKSRLCVFPATAKINTSVWFELQDLKARLQAVVVTGIDSVKRAVINKDTFKTYTAEVRLLRAAHVARCRTASALASHEQHASVQSSARLLTFVPVSGGAHFLHYQTLGTYRVVWAVEEGRHVKAGTRLCTLEATDATEPLWAIDVVAGEAATLVQQCHQGTTPVEPRLPPGKTALVVANLVGLLRTDAHPEDVVPISWCGDWKLKPAEGLAAAPEVSTEGGGGDPSDGSTNAVDADLAAIAQARSSDRHAEGSVVLKFVPERFKLLVDGSDLLRVMTTPGVDGLHTYSNHAPEVESVLGIEAARVKVIGELLYTMSEHGISLDRRHVLLTGDLMTCTGKVLGINRFGIERWKSSVMMLASFEKTTDILFEAAAYHRNDRICGVSECIIMGIPVPLGTGLMRVGHASSASNMGWNRPSARVLRQATAYRGLSYGLPNPGVG